jgi:hypothetical protein
METIDQGTWEALRDAPGKEARPVFCSMGEVVLIEPSLVSDAELMLRHRDSTLKLTFVPERSEVRWKLNKASGCRVLSQPLAFLAVTLVSLILV